MLAPRLVRAARTADDRHRSSPRADGTVLITGGTGALGALVARHLVTAHGVRHLLLLGRRGPEAAGRRRAGRRTRPRSAPRSTVAACDAADRDDLAALLADVPAEHPLTAVVHAAGVAGRRRAGLARRRSGSTRCCGPKADAAWHLHELTRDAGLAAFVLFSSAAGHPRQRRAGALRRRQRLPRRARPAPHGAGPARPSRWPGACGSSRPAWPPR